MPQFTVIDSLIHDGKIYAVGDEVELSATEAKPLIAAKVVAPKPQKRAEKPPP